MNTGTIVYYAIGNYNFVHETNEMNAGTETMVAVICTFGGS